MLSQSYCETVSSSPRACASRGLKNVFPECRGRSSLYSKLDVELFPVNLIFYDSLILGSQVHAPRMRHRSFLTRVQPTRLVRDFNLQSRDLQVARRFGRAVITTATVNLVNGGIVGSAAVVLLRVLCLTSTRPELYLREERDVWS